MLQLERERKREKREGEREKDCSLFLLLSPFLLLFPSHFLFPPVYLEFAGTFPYPFSRERPFQFGASSSTAALRAATSAPLTVASSTTRPPFTNLNVGTAEMFWSPQLFKTPSSSTSIL